MLYNMYTIIILHVWVAIINNYDCLLLMNHAEGYAPWCFHYYWKDDLIHRTSPHAHIALCSDW